MDKENSAIFIMKGFSASNVISSYSASEVQGYLFTPHADFTVTAVGRRETNNKQFVIELK
jgi:hypothetical protein